jgi:hypothetical protein
MILDPDAEANLPTLKILKMAKCRKVVTEGTASIPVITVTQKEKKWN